MSEIIRLAINKNKPHFLKYKKYIEENDWTRLKQTAPLFEGGTKGKQKTTVEIRKEEFDVQNQLIKAILERLTAFVKQNEGDKHLKTFKTFVNDTLDIINIHMERADGYISETNISKIEDVDLKANEIAFHNHLFRVTSSVEETVATLRVKEEQLTEGIQWLSGHKATLPMHKDLSLQYPEIGAKLKTMNIDFDSPPPQTLHILNEDPPVWNEEKNYWEQDRDVLDYYIQELKKIDQGVWIDDYYIDGWLYFHFNFFVTNIPTTVVKGGIEENEDRTIVPELRDNEILITDYFNKSKKEGLMSLIAATRRAAKTTMNSSRLFRAMVLAKKQILCAGGASEDLGHISANIETCKDNINPAFRLNYLSTTEDGRGKCYGIKTKDNKSKIIANVFIINLEGGTSKKKKETLAGFTPDEFILDEAMKFGFKSQLEALEPALWGSGVLRCSSIITGTGGSSDLAADAIKMLNNPENNKICLMDWDSLERNIPKELITWKRRKFGLFLPTQMSVKHKKIKSNLADYLGIKSETLSKVNLWVTDWENSKIAEEKERQVKAEDRVSYVRQLAYHPFDPDEIFLSGEISPFSNVLEEAKSHREYLLETGKWDNRRNLRRDSNGVIVSEISTEELVPFPFLGSNQDAPFNIIEKPDNDKNPKYYYVASADFYKQETSSETDSVCTVIIYKYPLFGDPSAKKIVATYAGRPATFRILNEKILILLEYYDAVLFPENEDLAVFQTFLESKHLEDTYLEKHIDFSGTLTYSENYARKWGWTPRKDKNKLMGLFVNYLEEPVQILNDLGQVVEVKRIQTIDDIHILSEILNYNKSGNFDRVSGALGGVALLHFLEKNYIYPKGLSKKREETQIDLPKQAKKVEFFRKTPQRSFYKKR
jgi:hypothetical protein